MTSSTDEGKATVKKRYRQFTAKGWEWSNRMGHATVGGGPVLWPREERREGYRGWERTNFFPQGGVGSVSLREGGEDKTIKERGK